MPTATFPDFISRTRHLSLILFPQACILRYIVPRVYTNTIDTFLFSASSPANHAFFFFFFPLPLENKVETRESMSESRRVSLGVRMTGKTKKKKNERAYYVSKKRTTEMFLNNFVYAFLATDAKLDVW